jgi:ADP-ribose pyrophosphatase
LFAAPPWLSVHQEEVRLPSGKLIRDFYRVVLPEFAMVAAFTADRRIVLVRGYKHGPRRTILSPPAGLIEPGEEPLAAAQRELLEETGYGGGTWKAHGKFVVDGNRQCGTMHLFAAMGVEPRRKAREDDMEVLSIEILPVDRAREALTNGEVATMAAAAGLGIALSVYGDGGW